MDKVEVGQYYYVADLNHVNTSYRVQVLEIINSKVVKVINSPKSSKQRSKYKPFNIPIDALHETAWEAGIRGRDELKRERKRVKKNKNKNKFRKKNIENRKAKEKNNEDGSTMNSVEDLLSVQDDDPRFEWVLKILYEFDIKIPLLSWCGMTLEEVENAYNELKEEQA